MGFGRKYMMLFYSACGKPTPYIERGDQVKNAYWLVSLMQGMNVFSLLFLVNLFTPIKELPKIAFGLLFAIPFVVNYFVYLKKGNGKILKTVDQLIKEGHLKNKAYVVKYVLFTIVFLVLSASVNNGQVRSWLTIE